MYSQQNQTKLCPDCQRNGVETLIVWRENPEKPGFKPGTNKRFMMPVEVNSQQRHMCPYFTPQARAQTTMTNVPQQTTTAPPYRGFTPNNNTAEEILTELKSINKNQGQIVEYLEVLAADKIKSGGLKKASEIETESERQNNTSYAYTPEDDMPT